MAKYFTDDEIKQIRDILKGKNELEGFALNAEYTNKDNCAVFIFYCGEKKIPVIVSKDEKIKDNIPWEYRKYQIGYTGVVVYNVTDIIEIILEDFIPN